MKKQNQFLLVVAFSLVVTLNFVSAIGVTPGKTTLSYPDGLEEIRSFTILDVSEDSLGVEISFRGNLSQYLEIENSPESLYPYEESNKYYYELDIPDEVLKILEPGEHTIEVIIKEKVDEEVFAVAIPSVSHQITFFIPYPSKYLVSDVEIIEAAANETTEFIIPVANLGNETIESVYGEITIYNKSGEGLIDNLATDVSSLDSMERTDLSAGWDADVPSGIYQSKIDLIYDDEIATYYKYFKVGDIYLDVSDILISDFELGNIVTFYLLVDNQWGEDLNNIYTSMKLYNENGNLAYEVKSPVNSVEAFEKKRIPIYWDTANVSEGVYDGELIVYYDLYKTTKTLHVEILDNDIRVQIQEGEFVLATPSHKRGIFILSLIVLVTLAIIIFKKLTKKK